MTKKVFVSVIVFGFTLTACTQQKVSSLPKPSVVVSSAATAASPLAVVHASGAAMAQPTKTFTVSGAKFKFTPAILTVKKGDVVKVIFKSEDIMHDFTLPDFKVASKTISAGQEDSVTFTADKTGTFQFYCSVGNHKAMGMVGKLIVE